MGRSRWPCNLLTCISLAGGIHILRMVMVVVIGRVMVWRWCIRLEEVSLGRVTWQGRSWFAVLTLAHPWWGLATILQTLSCPAASYSH